MTKLAIKFRSDSAGGWTTHNPTLAFGEIGVEFDSADGVAPKFKIGNGINAWNDSATKYFINDSDQAGLGGGGSSGITYVGDRGLVFGGWPANSGSVYHSNVIMYFDITTPGNASDFGDLNAICKWCSAGSNGTRAVNAHGENSSYAAVDIIDYVTTATTGNATDFGNLTVARSYLGDCAAYNSTRVLWAGGYDTPNYNLRNEIDYITTATAGNATDFGNLLAGTAGVTGTSSETYGIFSGGFTGSNLNVIQYVTIGTPGNSADFGDLTTDKYMGANSSNGHGGL